MLVILYDELNTKSHRYKVTFNVDSPYICTIERKSWFNLLIFAFVTQGCCLFKSFIMSLHIYICLHFPNNNSLRRLANKFVPYWKYEFYAYYIKGSTFGTCNTLKEPNHNSQLKSVGLILFTFCNCNFI